MGCICAPRVRCTSVLRRFCWCMDALHSFVSKQRLRVQLQVKTMWQPHECVLKMACRSSVAPPDALVSLPMDKAVHPSAKFSVGKIVGLESTPSMQTLQSCSSPRIWSAAAMCGSTSCLCAQAGSHTGWMSWSKHRMLASIWIPMLTSLVSLLTRL